jgi:Ca-activated chloride channel family protein
MFDGAGYGSLYVERDNKLEWVCNLDNNTTRQTLTLLPGNYRVVFRAKNVRNAMYSIEKTFKITSGASNPVYVK